MNPKVFISHASEDKQRFVLDFAKQLRAKGIDAWVDKWEMQPGDSLIDKIFNEGIKNADAFIVVLSNISMNKKWVSEELNAALIKRIEKNTRIIPILIDNCEIPIPLKNTFWVKINLDHNYDNDVKSIVNSIYNFSEKPPIGLPPEYIKKELISFPTLEKLDILTYNYACELSIENDDYRLYSEDLLNKINDPDITMEMLQESLSILESKYYIRVDQKSITGFIHELKIANTSFTEYLCIKYPDYSIYERDIAFKIVNEEKYFSSAIAEELKIPHMIVVNIMENFLSQGYYKANHAIPNIILIYQVSPTMHRMVKSLDRI